MRMNASKLFVLALLPAAVLMMAPASAQMARPAVVYDYADVLSVQPLKRMVERPVTRHQCRDQPVVYRTPPHYVQRPAPASSVILGGILGGVLGNQFGHGSGRAAATVAGAALGQALVVDSQGSYYEPSREYTRMERHCQPYTQYQREEQVTGYEVTYEYRGRVHRAVTDYPPGDQMRIRVSARAPY